MKRSLTLTAALLLVSTYSFAQPKISLSKKDIDLGTIYRGDVRKASFTVKNIGNEPLKILQVLPSCGCTALMKPKEVLQPGEVDTILFEFNSSSFRGRVDHKRIDVMSNDPVAEYVFVNLTAEVKEELVPVENGPSLIWFGTVVQGKTAEQKITFQNVSGKTIGIRKLVPSNTRLKVSNSKKSLKPQETVDVIVTVTADKEGYTSDHVDIQTDSANQSKVVINVSFIGMKGS